MTARAARTAGTAETVTDVTANGDFVVAFQPSSDVVAVVAVPAVPGVLAVAAILLVASIAEDRVTTHQQSNIDQFTRQAVHFSEMPGHNDEESLKLLITAAGLTDRDTVLDVACGSGIVACAFAAVASEVTGIDITPAMLEQARSLQAARGLTNLIWHQGDIETLPFHDSSFSVVLSRYAFHHFLHPEKALPEMVRVCRPGGRVLIADAVLPEDQVEAYNQFERLLDPSHARALTFAELSRLVTDAGLQNVRLQFYRMEMELEQQLATSFPNPGDEARIRRLVREDIGTDRLGIGAHLRGESIHYSYPVTVLVGEKPAQTCPTVEDAV